MRFGENAMPTKTRKVAALLGVPEFRLHYAIRNGKIPPPAKDSSGDYCWSPDDIERARLALRTDRRERQALSR
jgi:DNA-binding transcriptional MerR regulator